jgi:iron complex outermembrane receptor protein
MQGSRGVKTADGEQDSQNVDLFGEGQIHVTHDVSAILGMQAMYADRNYTNNLNQVNNADKDTYQYNPKIGMLWDVTPASQVFANVSRSSEVATFSELVQSPVPGFVPLEPQTAWTTEIGTRGKQGVLAWDLTAYHANVDNELLQFTTNPTVPASTFNANHTTHQGLELGGAWDIARDWLKTKDALVLSQLYTFNDFHFNNDPQYGDNQIAGVPRHLLRTELEYRQPQWSIAPNVEWAPEAPYADYANTLKASSYVVLNLQGHHKLTDNIDFYAEGRNLLDKHYISNVSTVANGSIGPAPAVFYPGEGRGFFAGIRAKF